jgi:tetratricopeptide (TPR) repeat protein
MFVLILFAALTLSAQRAKPAFDPDTKEGLLIQHIQQESDRVEKLRYMEQFAAQFPSHPAIAWVYDQLQPALFETKEYDAALHIGTLRLLLEPDNLEAAKIALRAAEALRKPDPMVQWADTVWRLASAVAAKGGPGAAEAPASENYADFCAYTAAEQIADPKGRLAVLEQIEHRNPSSNFLRNVAVEYYQIYHQLGDEEKASAMAQRALVTDPENVEMLLALAGYQFHKSSPRSRQDALANSAKAVEILQTKSRPPMWTDEDWEKKKSQMLGLGYYLGGMSASMLNNFVKADAMLRGALPLLKENEAQEAAVLYHLGMANYRLAEAGNDRSRPVDAIRFLRRCAAMKGPFQEQAAKYVESIRSEYSLP